MAIRPNTLLGTTVVVLILLFSAAGRLLFLGRTVRAEGPARFLQCDSCGYEEPYAQKNVGKTCPKFTCPKFKGPVLAPGAESLAGVKRQASPIWQNPMAVCITTLAAGLAIIHLYLYVRARLPAADAEKGPFSYCRCARCKRRVRFAASAAIQKLKCPTCQGRLDVVGAASAAR